MLLRDFRTTVLAASVAASTVLGLASSAGAQGWHRGGDGDAFAIMHQLDLTSQQKQQIHALMRANREATESTRQQLRSVHAQLETALYSAGNVTSATVMPLLQQEEQLRATLDQARLSTAFGIRAVLTPSQLQQASSLHSQLASLHQQEHALTSAGPSGAAAAAN